MYQNSYSNQVCSIPNPKLHNPFIRRPKTISYIQLVSCPSNQPVPVRLTLIPSTTALNYEIQVGLTKTIITPDCVILCGMQFLSGNGQSPASIQYYVIWASLSKSTKDWSGKFSLAPLENYLTKKFGVVQ